jgi:phosphoribosylamine--glycine ligase
MRVLVVGGGGREHALCAAIARSPLLSKLWCAPGNPGTASLAECVALDPLDIPGLVGFAVAERADLVVPGGEISLVAGIADAMAAAGIRCAGPGREAARLEGSKAFTKMLCDAAGIPTAAWRGFDQEGAAIAYIQAHGAPVVVKADGLAGGKGVVVAASEAEAIEAVCAALQSGPVVIEECLSGEELSVFALCDGTSAVLLGAAQDHKRVGDGDTGPNTGGMGAYSPPPAFTDSLAASVMADFIQPTLREMAGRGIPFRGILFAGLMLTDSGPKLIEYNVRFGDPECQVLLPLLSSDLLPALVACCDGGLEAVPLLWSGMACLGVVVAARGYPAAPSRGGAIAGIGRAEAAEGVTVFHAGTARGADGALRAAGGRVLTVCACAPDLRMARDLAYRAVREIDFPDGFYRSDIGASALN